MCTRNVLAAGLVLGAIVSAVALARDFGPEWQKDGADYVRTIQITLRHSRDGNTTGGTVKLEHNDIHVGEIDANAGVSMGWGRNVGLDIRKADGKPYRYKILLGKMQYYDLDCDGVLDTMTDGRGAKPRIFIFFDGHQTEIALTRLYGDVDHARSLDGTKHFALKSGKWEIVE